MEHLAAELLAFIKANPGWAMSVIAITAFGESFAFLSLLFPGTTILIASGGLVQAGVIPFFSTALAGIAGAVLGDAISFWLGQKFGPLLPAIWPFRGHPDMLERGAAFFRRFGGLSVFIGRFFGPLRAVIPIAAGTLRMPAGFFYVANILSALIWAPALIFSGQLITLVTRSLLKRGTGSVMLVAVAAAAIAIVAAFYFLRRRFAPVRK
jgi:membrane protein DedA with SNARE-associated domain